MTEKTTIVNGKVESDVKLDGKTVIITGANTGIGYETALNLAKRGAKIIMACRDAGRAETAKTKLLEEVKDAQLIFKKLDLASLKSVREFAKDIHDNEDRLDILINNAGIMLCPHWKTEDGFEMQFGVNHLGHFLLTNLLIDLLKKSAPSRVVIVSSYAYKAGSMLWKDVMQENNYDSGNAYQQSKLANIHYCRELSKRLEGSGVTCYSLHPGIINTELGRHLDNIDHLPFMKRILLKAALPIMKRFVAITPEMGSQTSVYCAIAPELANESGKFYANCAEQTLQRHALVQEDAERLWKLSEELTKEQPKEEAKEEEDQQS